jgi:[protein-PII] uridylyltransferase
VIATTFRDERAALLASGSKGAAFAREYSDLVDEWMRKLLGDEPDVAVVAVGGYGRAELCPCSDIDVLLIHRGRKDIKGVAKRLWYPLWDAGLKLGHGVRTAKEAVKLAESDIEVATSLLEVRAVAGDAAMVDELAAKVRDGWSRRATRWLAALGAVVAGRHVEAGEVAFLLEPDLKEGRGGLRDVHALRWAEAAGRVLLPDDHRSLADAYGVLLDVRVELHRRTSKPNDRLLLQEQDAIATALGDADADALMARVAAAARTIAWTSDESWWRIRATLEGPRGRAITEHRAGPGVLVRDGQAELAPDADVANDAGLPLRLATAAARARVRISRSALERLATDTPAPASPWPDAVRHALVELLACGRDAIPLLEALDQKGLVVRLLPEWDAVRCRPQRNAYHRFTVDRHLCEAAAEAASLAATVSRPDLLLLGTWLHDIGKGFPGDHTAAGMEVVEDIAVRMGFTSDDAAVLVALVEHHLLLADTATRRDLDDDETIAATARAIGDPLRLELLDALTQADSIATGPAAWGPWKAGLVRDLVARTARVLGGERPEATTGAGAPGIEVWDLVNRAREANGPVVELRDDGTITVVAGDRPGLFCRVAGALALLGLNVLDARAWNVDGGLAVESFRVEPAYAGPPDAETVEQEVLAAITGRVSIEARLADKARAYGIQKPPRSAQPAQRRVHVDAEASATATVVEVRAPDAVGTLYRITRALSELELDIRTAKIATLGHEVVDTFYVLDHAGQRITDPAYAREIERAVLAELARVAS